MHGRISYVVSAGVKHMTENMRAMRSDHKSVYTTEEQIKAERARTIDLAMAHGLAIRVH